MGKKDSKKDIETGNNPFVEESIEENTQQTEQAVVDNEKEKLQAELEELKNQYIRMAADFDNYRKRQIQERESLLKYGAEDTLKKFLQVVDTFERAKSSLQDINDCEQIKESIDVIYKQFLDAFEKSGVKKIETVGQEFDHNLHEAVMQTPTDEYPNHTIINELQGGYMLEDRVLRAALVNVAVNE